MACTSGAAQPVEPFAQIGDDRGDRRSEVDVAREPRDHPRSHVGSAHEERDPDRLVVQVSLADQAVPAEREAVVGDAKTA